MDDRNLDHLLAQHRELPLPPLSPTFQQGVWREVRRRKAEGAERHASRFSWWFEPLLRPAMAFSALGIALVLGVGLGATAMADSRNMHTRVALDLEVFGSSSPALPATLMGYSK